MSGYEKNEGCKLEDVSFSARQVFSFRVSWHLPASGRSGIGIAKNLPNSGNAAEQVFQTLAAAPEE